MKKIFAAMLLVVGMTANAQNVKDSTEITFVDSPGYNHTVRTYAIHFEKVIYSSVSNGSSKGKEVKNASVIAFNPLTHKMYIIAQKNDSTKIKEAIQTYLGKMSSLKNKYFYDCTDNEILFRIRFNTSASEESVADTKMDSIMAAFEDEAWQGLSKYSDKKLESYNPYTDKAIIKSSEINTDMTNGLNVWILNNYIKKKTNGNFSNADDFQKALKNKDEKAIEYAKKM